MTDTYFRDYLTRTGDASVIKMDHYLDIYPELLGHLKGRDIRFLEIGVYKGGSIPMWKGYFGPGAALTFLDIDPACRALAVDGTTVEIGDQEDAAFLEDVARRHGPFDVIIDDGGHKMGQQKTSFRALFPHLADRGLYIVEDTHTSYWPGFGGGFRAKGSFIEAMKDLIDRMHSWYTDEDDRFPAHAARMLIRSIRFYDSIVAVEKEVKSGAPISITAQNGKVTGSRKLLEVRGRTSIF